MMAVAAKQDPRPSSDLRTKASTGKTSPSPSGSIKRTDSWKRSHGWVYLGTNGETRETDKATTSRTTAPALDPTGIGEQGVSPVQVMRRSRANGRGVIFVTQ